MILLLYVYLLFIDRIKSYAKRILVQYQAYTSLIFFSKKKKLKSGKERYLLIIDLNKIRIG